MSQELAREYLVLGFLIVYFVWYDPYIISTNLILSNL